MYYLLVEAAGIRQIAKIRPERYREFVEHLDAVMAPGGFSKALGEGDLLLFQQGRDMTVQPELLASVARSMMEVLRSESEDLLDFLIVIDYRDAVVAQEELVRMQRVLRRARSQNAAYVTEPVRSAIEPLIQSEAHGDIHRIVAFTGGDHVIRQPFLDTVAPEEVIRGISSSLRPEPARITHFIGADTSLIAAALSRVETTAMERVVVQCRSTTTVETILQAVVAQLPELSGERQAQYGVDEIDQRERFAVSVLLTRFADPTTLLLSEGWRRGELGMLLRRWATVAALHRQWIIVELRDLDLVSPGVVSSVEHYLAPQDGPRSIRIVATASERLPVSEDTTRLTEGRRIVELVTPDSERSGAALAYWRQPEHDPRRLSRPHRHIVFLLYRMEGVLNDEAIAPFVAAMGITPAERVRVLQELEELGLVQHPWTLQVNPAVESLMDSIVSTDERSDLEETIHQVMSDQLRSAALPLSPSILQLLQREPEEGSTEGRRHSVLHTLAGGGAFDAVQRLVGDEGALSLRDRATEASARVRLYLRDSRGPEHCGDDSALLTTASGDEKLPPEVRADFLLSLGEFRLAERNYQQALNAAKHATVLLQSAGSPRLGASHLLMARVLLVQRRLGDAGRYLTFAREEANDDLATELIARSLEAIRLFLAGNLSRSATHFSELIEPLLKSGFSEWLLLAWFALGRIDFELGAYHRAAAQFSLTRDWAEECGMDYPARTVGAWMLRARYLADERLSPDYLDRVPSELTAEEKLFVAEARITRNEYREALELLDAAEEQEREAHRWPRLGVCWDNGYAPMEDLLIADRIGRSELLRMIQAFRALMLALTDRQDEAVAILYRLTRGNDGLSVDPYAGLFNYLYACILPAERSADRDDRATVLGKSVKLVQERMSRIDDYQDKMRYLRSNTWNRRLMDAARRHNLVS
jgi:tetratricopeptide (TPR) repeat protein